jgi:hypothetical protein
MELALTTQIRYFLLIRDFLDPPIDAPNTCDSEPPASHNGAAELFAAEWASLAAIGRMREMTKCEYPT